MSRRTFGISPLLVIVAAGFGAASARADCAADLEQARAIATRLTVDVEVPQRPRVGEPIKVTWRNVHAERPATPAYLVLTTAAEVRFGGKGFMALSAGVKGPYGLSHGDDGSRAFVPLHRAIEPAKAGELSVIPYHSRTQTIGWAVVSAGPCGEQVFGRGGKTIEVATGVPEIVVQDRFATGTPQKRIRSRNGAYELRVFKDRYEVYELATGAKIVDRAGREPNFSPASRFVAARALSGGVYEVIDLVSGQPLKLARDPYEYTSFGFLAWARGDSYLLHGQSAHGAVQLWNAIVDGDAIVEEAMHATNSNAWQNVQGFLDVDRGFFAARSGTFSGRFAARGRETPDVGPAIVVDLVTRESTEVQDLNAPDRKSGGDLINAHVRRVFDPTYPGVPNAWSLDGALALSHAVSAAEEPQLAREQARFVVSHDGQRGTATSAQAGAPGTLRGRSATGRGMTPADAVAPRPGSFGLQNLGAAGLALHPSAPVDDVEADALRRVMASGYEPKSAHPQVRQIARDIRARVPAAAKLLGGDDRELECSDTEGLPKDEVFIGTLRIAGVWHWRESEGDRWLLQTACYRTQYIFISYLVLVKEGGHGSVTLLHGISTQWSFGPAARAKVFRPADGLLAVVIPAESNLMLIRAGDDPAKVNARNDVEDGSLLADLRLTADEKHLVQLNADGRFFVHRLSDRKRVLIGAQVDDEIVVANDDGLYDTSYEGAQAVQVRFAGMRGLHRFNQFEAALRRPGLATDVLAGRSVAPPPTVPAPPSADLTLDAAARNGRRTGKAMAASERELSAVRLYVDGRLVEQVAVKGTRAEVPVDLPDPGGGRWISAVAVDAQGLVSQPSAVQMPGKPAPRGTLRAVVVGVDAYEDRALPRLAYAKSDAQRFVRALAASRGKTAQQVQATSLLDAEVTPERVLAGVRAAAQATMPDDTLVIFYAGHGLDGRAGGQSDAGLVLTTPKTRMADLKATALPWAALADALSDARGTIVVVLDACHAGIAGSDAFATNDDAVSALMTRAGAPMVVLAGSKGRQQSHETPRAGGGLFTEAIAAAISEARATHDRDRSGLIDLGELYGAVKARVFAATKGRQTPWLARNALVGEMALF